ncbi:MFS transporter [Kitasatospora cathayae]|uniref:MFS transporter n=1 Tax=Kitasatospora cathayae TaxID=3004092 RepID=A0ABY7QDH4_9ACTN|nr:MFS transporter [Kitasatospora sp. HUAS 3-15]WBP90810.1 MFS transporter [Kitasatospora sp. HUAS 3-15]
MNAYADLPPRRRILASTALLGCAFLAMLDGTVVGTALPRIVQQVGGGGTWYVWLVTAYLLTSSVSVPVYGRFSDLYGRRRLLLGGLALFLTGSTACALAAGMPALVASRAVQGLGAGALLTLGMALIRDLHPPSRPQGLIRMQTALAAMMVLGLVGGPILGGLLADHAGWRWSFWLNLPLGLAAWALIALTLPEHRPATTPPGRLDAAGILLLTSGLGLVLTGLSLKGNAADGRWSDPAVGGCLLGGLALLALLVPVERRAAVPVLPLRLFHNRTYSALLAAGFLLQVAAMPVGILLPLYFQQQRGYSATASGLLLLPLLVGMTVGNRLTAAAVTHGRQVRSVLLTGAALLTAGTGGLLPLGPATPVPLTSVLLLLIGLGTGPAMGGLTIATQSCVRPADMGTATAGSALAKQIGGAFGLACAQSLLAPSGTAIGPTIAWTGIPAGLLAAGALLLVRDLTIATPNRRVAAGSSQRSEHKGLV